MNSDTATLSDLIGPWADTDFESSLIERCKNAWSTPLQDLSSAELATLLQQRIAVTYLLPLARKRLKDRIEDGTEMYEGELERLLSMQATRPKPSALRNITSAPD